MRKIIEARAAKFWNVYGEHIKWLATDSLALLAMGLFLATIAVWAGLWTRVF